MKPTSPPVTVIPRLLFANELPKQLTTSLIASEYNVEGWQKPTPGLYEQPLVEKEVSLVLGLVVRDFVETWFGEVSADVAFPRCVYKQIVQALESIVERVRGVDLAECIVGVCLPLVTTHLGTIRDGNLEGVRWHSAISSIVGGEDSPNSEVQQKRAVMGHVRRVVDLIVPLVLSHDQASFAPHRVLVREILTGALLTPLVQSLADPDTINQMVDGQLEKLIREQHMVSELRDVLDQQAKVEEQDQQQQREEDESMVRTYDQFMAIIDECKNKEELERIRDDILAQIRKRRILIMGQNKDDIVHGQRVGDIIVYVNRLYVAKKKAERRLELLKKQVPQRQQQQQQQQQQPSFLQQRQTQQHGGESGGGVVVSRRPGLAKNAASRVSTYYEHRDDPTKLGPPQFTLREILTNVSSLSAFAEYMDLIGSQFLLEFWINVEGVRQPRPEVFPNIVASLWKTYFTLRVDELAEAGDNVDLAITRVQRCLKPLRMSGSLDLDVNGLSFDLCTEALALICLVQEAVFKYMETSVFPAFLRSAFYSRVLKEYYVTPRQDQLSEKLFLQQQQQQQQTGKPDSLDQIVDEEDNDDNDSGKASETQQTVVKPVTKSASVSGSASPRRPARRLSLVKSVTGSLGSKRSVSGGSLAQAVSSSSMGRKWNLSLRAKPEAPLVSTTTAIAEKSTQQTLAVPGMDRGRQSGRSIVQLAEALNNEQSPRAEPRSLPKMDISSRPQTPIASASVRSLPLEPAEHAEPVQRTESMQASSSQGQQQQQQQQTFGQLDSGGEPLALGRRRSTRVGRSEVRRLSASLRSIALSSNGEIGEDGGLQMMSPLEAALGPSSAATEYDSGTSEIASQSEVERDHQESEEDDSEAADEAESLVLARVLTTPAPGDLFLDQRLRHLSRDIARKTHQMAIVRALMRQAQTRHRGNEQRVLQASYRALRAEVREAQEQERLYVDALDDHRLTKARTRVHIPRAIMREEEDGDSHVTYLIEVQQSLPAQYAGGSDPSSCPSSSGRAPTTGWVVARRYREFFAMHRDLKALLPVEMRGTELPNRTPLIRLQKDRDIEHRRAGLERYVQGLLADPKVCAALPLKLFLSSTVPPQPSPGDPGPAAGGGGDRGGAADDDDDGRVAGWMARIHKTVGADIEGVTGADSMLELIVQELGAQVAMQHQLHAGNAAADASQGAFVDPLSDLFVEVFGLKNRRNWLRRQAISILLRHIVGGAVERRIREVFGNLAGDQQLAQLLGSLRASLWPANPSRPGAFLQFQGFRKRTDAEKTEAARKARAQILWYVPRILAGMVGKKNARDGAQRLIDGVQMPLPNLNLVLHVFDALVGVVFPEIKFQLREE
ncbi:tRNA (guanine-N(7)-)-methyltransferase (tRNA(m7G46)-methyltransferase) [Coemansia sp. RSA 486]|nr:tRNA (guanine-N(7)-)-methyltransferase (tRNA(m7G46)-methyltransferase) [Coemansia sp. RSA 486]